MFFMYFDAHSDIWTDVTAKRLKGETDVFHRLHAPRLKAGGVEGSIFVIWVDPPHTRDYAGRTRQIMQCIRDEAAEAKDFRIVKSFSEMLKAEEEGLIYVFLGLEGMAYVGEDISRVEEYYEFGARHAMLTWNECNSLGCGASNQDGGGLTPLGKKVARLVQDKGMILDVSHLNDAGFWDVAGQAVKPVIASHSNCRALRDVKRNLTDEQLRAIRDMGGVVGLNAYNSFVKFPADSASVEDLARHAAHMIDVMGIDHVGCGFDFFEFLGDPDDPEAYSGEGTSTAGLSSSAEIPNLFRCFRDMGMSAEDMEKIARGNFRRVIKECIGG